MRFGQVNLRETDPDSIDSEWWADSWHRCRLHGVVLNACGIVARAPAARSIAAAGDPGWKACATAYYPTRIPLHRRSPWLGDRDLFGELCAAAKRNRLRMLARVDPSRAERDVQEADPDWFIRRPDGTPSRADGLYQTCINGPYYYEFVPSLFREIPARYDVDGCFGNAWSGARELYHCGHCQAKCRRELGTDLPARPEAEQRLWLAEAVAADSRPWFTIIGGGLVATFGSSLFDARPTSVGAPRRRSDFGLVDHFGVRAAPGEPSGPLDHATMRIEDPSHPQLRGIEETDRTLFGGLLAPIADAGHAPRRDMSTE